MLLLLLLLLLLLACLVLVVVKKDRGPVLDDKDFTGEESKTRTRKLVLDLFFMRIILAAVAIKNGRDRSTQVQSGKRGSFYRFGSPKNGSSRIFCYNCDDCIRTNL
jgi:hypothetical protein